MRGLEAAAGDIPRQSRSRPRRRLHCFHCSSSFIAPLTCPDGPTEPRVWSFRSYPLTASRSRLPRAPSPTCQRRQSPELAGPLHQRVNLSTNMPTSSLCRPDPASCCEGANSGVRNIGIIPLHFGVSRHRCGHGEDPFRLSEQGFWRAKTLVEPARRCDAIRGGSARPPRGRAGDVRPHPTSRVTSGLRRP
jgi:hypothetical protein